MTVIPSDDRGLLLGDGLFETVLVKAGELVGAASHLDRMAAGCEALGLPALDRGQAERLMREAVAACAGPRVAVRLTLTAGSGGRGLDRPMAPASRLFATAAPSPAPEGPARLVVSTVRRNEGSPAARLKTLSYLDNVLARAEARAAGADEALMLNCRGEVAGAAAANLFWLSNGALFTPALECGVLAGTMRARVIAAAGRLGAPVREVRSRLPDLQAAQALFLTNALIGVRPVASLDGREFASHALVGRLQAAVS